jgi:hypothetical protein
MVALAVLADPRGPGALAVVCVIFAVVAVVTP